jgi:hypothetical protein
LVYRLVEAKWKMALNSLEKDHGLLRADYFQLVEMVGRFLTNCSTKLTGRTRSADTRPFANVTVGPNHSQLNIIRCFSNYLKYTYLF